MKTSLVVLLLTIIGSVSLNSCSKKSDDITPGQTTQSTVGFQVKADDKLYAPDFAYALASFPGANAYFVIYGIRCIGYAETNTRRRLVQCKYPPIKTVDMTAKRPV